MSVVPVPLVPAKAGTQGQELDARFRGHERKWLGA
jgi:hypothetical protein